MQNVVHMSFFFLIDEKAFDALSDRKLCLHETKATPLKCSCKEIVKPIDEQRPFLHLIHCQQE